MQKNDLFRVQALLFTVVGVLMAMLLLFLLFTPNLQVTQTRKASGYETARNVTCTGTTDEEGRSVQQFRFVLDEVDYDATLSFFVWHQNAAVYLDGEQVYTLCVSPQLSVIRTPGCNWVMIPLYREDTGREVLVELTAVYGDYQGQEIEFFVGSKYAVCAAQFLRSLPEMLLSFLDILSGMLLMMAAIYFSRKHVGEHGLYALGLLAISLGLWNFAQTGFAPILLPDYTVFVYYLSLTMLMISVLPLIKSVRRPKKAGFRRALNGLCIFAALFDTVQILLQLTGTMDLRQTLPVTHVMLIVGALLLTTNSFVTNVRELRAGTRPQGNLIWLLGFGVLADLTIYYFSDGDGGLPCTLLTLFLYVMSEGIHLFTGYVRQRNILKEKETQLTMSRITTMMSQIRSHFVFNILNAISGMCKYDPEKADETVVRFARYLRSNIDVMEDDRSIPFSTELERLEDYVILEQLRFGDRIRFEEDIRADGFELPPLILQPVVENAIKHGLGPKEEGGTIRLSTQETEQNVLITVSDDGVGFDTEAPEKKGSIGLKNIRFRLEHLVRGTLEVTSRPGAGTTVTISIPKENTV